MMRGNLCSGDTVMRGQYDEGTLMRGYCDEVHCDEGTML